MTLDPPMVELDPERIERMENGDHFELIDGNVVEKQIGAESDEVAFAPGSRLRDHA